MSRAPVPPDSNWDVSMCQELFETKNHGQVRSRTGTGPRDAQCWESRRVPDLGIQSSGTLSVSGANLCLTACFIPLQSDPFSSLCCRRIFFRSGNTCKNGSRIRWIRSCCPDWLPSRQWRCRMVNGCSGEQMVQQGIGQRSTW